MRLFRKRKSSSALAQNFDSMYGILSRPKLRLEVSRSLSPIEISCLADHIAQCRQQGYQVIVVGTGQNIPDEYIALGIYHSGEQTEYREYLKIQLVGQLTTVPCYEENPIELGNNHSATR